MAGSFDITGDELETTYPRNGLNGETEIKIMSMEEPNSTTSADLHSNVQSFCSRQNLDLYHSRYQGQIQYVLGGFILGCF